MIDWNEVDQELKRLDLKTFRTHLNSKDLEEIKRRTDQGANNFRIFQNLLAKIVKSKLLSSSASEEALLKLTTVLFLTEGPLGYYINIYSYGLILEKHHDVWFEEKQEFVSSFEEIERVPLSVKLKFLERHGFKSFSKICPKKVRNAIAHYNFHIEPEGTIDIEGQKLTKKESENIIHDITEMLNLLSKNFSERK